MSTNLVQSSINLFCLAFVRTVKHSCDLSCYVKVKVESVCYIDLAIPVNKENADNF